MGVIFTLHMCCTSTGKALYFSFFQPLSWVHNNNNNINLKTAISPITGKHYKKRKENTEFQKSTKK
jgi:hypothetical protein